jgi:hypothetical protein
MSRFAAMAERHYRQWFPEQVAQMKDPEAFFQGLEAEALDQIVELTDSLAGEAPPDEPFADRLARYSLARSNAEAVVIREVLLPDPDPSFQSPQPPDPADQELATALADFEEARQEWLSLQRQREESPPSTE